MGKNRGISHGHNTLAFVLIFFGAILLLDRIGIIDGFNFKDLWPIILIFIGIKILSKTRNEIFHYLIGAGFVLAGGVLLLRNFELIPYFHINWSLIWPILIIFFGLKLFFDSHNRNNEDCLNREHKTKVDKDYVDIAAFLGGGDFYNSSKNLKGGNLSAIMGGYKIVLTDADFKGDILELNVFAFWGGIEIFIPKNWKLNIKCIPIMGGVEHKRISEENGIIKDKTLVIKGTVIMAGVEIKS